MDIAYAEIRNNVLWVFGKNLDKIYSKALPKDACVVGFTCSVVTVKQGNIITTYDKHGGKIISKPIV